jgi:phosphocarrier protein
MSDVLRATVTVENSGGLHLRPVSLIAKTASGFESEIRIIRQGRAVDAKRTLELMTLGAAQGDELEIESSGADAEQALASILRLFEQNFS